MDVVDELAPEAHAMDDEGLVQFFGQAQGGEEGLVLQGEGSGAQGIEAALAEGNELGITGKAMGTLHKGVDVLHAGEVPGMELEAVVLQPNALIRCIRLYCRTAIAGSNGIGSNNALHPTDGDGEHRIGDTWGVRVYVAEPMHDVWF